ncbi:MAG: hypothetical protein ABSB91_04760 [Sedimentisphaerales bacterium]|jgi:hypothetical protein
MNSEKLKQILNKIGQADVPPDIALLAGQVSRNFSAALKIPRPQHWFLTPVRLLAAAAVIVFAFALGRWSKPIPPKITIYASQSPSRLTAQSNNDSFWQQKTMAAMQSRPYAQSTGNLLNLYKQYLKEKQND